MWSKRGEGKKLEMQIKKMRSYFPYKIFSAIVILYSKRLKCSSLSALALVIQSHAFKLTSPIDCLQMNNVKS